MEITLGEMPKLFSESQAKGSSQPPLLLATLQNGKQWKELRTCLQQRLVKEVIAEVARIEVLPAEFLVATPTATLVIVKTKKTEKDLDTKTTSSEPSS